MAARMGQNGEPDKTQVTERFKENFGISNEELGIKFKLGCEIEIKGKGIMKTWFMKK